MSSDMKDARWHVAEKMAKADGSDFYALSYDGKVAYLRLAKESLDGRPAEVIQSYAAAFRTEPDNSD